MPGLTPEARLKLETVLELIAADPRSLTSVRDPAEAWRAHVADSLTGLEVPALCGASRIADLGAGAGFPGLVLALSLPQAQVDLIESVTRKCDFMRDAIAEAGIPNAQVVNARSEEHARAVRRAARPTTPSPHVRSRAWRRSPSSPRRSFARKACSSPGRAAATRTRRPSLTARSTRPRWSAVEVREVGESAGYEHRHLHVLHKIGPTPAEPSKTPRHGEEANPQPTLKGVTGSDPVEGGRGFALRS